jgi:predicted amidohydrolase YtcJ
MSPGCSPPTFFRRACFSSPQLYEPYSDNPETRGFMRLSTEVLNEIIPNFLRDGWQVVSPVTPDLRCPYVNLDLQNIHAIGDRANAIVLDTFENALKDTNVTALRPRLEHAQIMTKRDMGRLGKLGGKSAGTFHLLEFVLIKGAIQSSPASNLPMRELKT